MSLFAYGTARGLGAVVGFIVQGALVGVGAVVGTLWVVLTR